MGRPDYCGGCGLITGVEDIIKRFPDEYGGVKMWTVPWDWGMTSDPVGFCAECHQSIERLLQQWWKSRKDKAKE